MSVFASSWLVGSTGFVRLVSDSAWESDVWKLAAVFPGTMTDVSLYPLSWSGKGVLSDEGCVLLCEIPNPPKQFLLSVGKFGKVFSMLEGGVDSGSELVWVPVCKVAALGDEYDSRSYRGCLAWFNGLPEFVCKGVSYRASLLDESGSVVGVCLGEPFVNVSSGNRNYGFGGVLFSRVLWLREVQAGVLTFVCSFDSGAAARKVVWDGKVFAAPSKRFAVKADHTFIMRRLNAVRHYRKMI